MVVDALVGWMDLSKQTAATATLLRHFVQTVLTFDAPVLHEAIRRQLAPGGTLAELSRVQQVTWAVAKECYVAQLFLARRVKKADLETLFKVPDVAPARADVEAAFGLTLPRPTRFRKRGGIGGPAELRSRVESGSGRLEDLTVRELLTLANPVQTLGEGWGSGLSWLIQNQVHFAELLTREGVHALGRYLARRADELVASSAQASSASSGTIDGGHAADGRATIVEVGAGSGRLAALLNASGTLGRHRLIATEPYSQDGPSAVDGTRRFPVERLTADESIRRYKPQLVLCHWMEFGTDLTPSWRKAKVPEYVLIGELGVRPPPPASAANGAGVHEFVYPDGKTRRVSAAEYQALAGSCCYSLNVPHDDPAYAPPLLLEDVSRELLHIHVAQDAEERAMRGREGGREDEEGGQGICAAVAFRRL